MNIKPNIYKDFCNPPTKERMLNNLRKDFVCTITKLILISTYIIII